MGREEKREGGETKEGTAREKGERTTPKVEWRGLLKAHGASKSAHNSK